MHVPSGFCHQRQEGLSKGEPSCFQHIDGKSTRAWDFPTTHASNGSKDIMSRHERVRIRRNTCGPRAMKLCQLNRVNRNASFKGSKLFTPNLLTLFI